MRKRSMAILLGLGALLGVSAIALLGATGATQDLSFYPRAVRIDWTGLKVGVTGTQTNLIELHDLTFSAGTTATATCGTPTTYYLLSGWKSTSADPGYVTLAVADGTLTATAANATTGTLCVMIVGSP